MSDSLPEIHITAEPQSLPTNCLFRVDRNLYVGTIYVSDAEVAREWVPLAAAILDQVEGIKGVRISHAEVLISMLHTPADWREVARSTGAVIRTFLSEGGTPVLSGAAEHLTGHDAHRAKAQQVVDEQLNPNLASHGGWVEIQASDGADLYMTMGGGCQGCGSAAATMRQGVEAAIRQAVPEIGAIHDATDHAAGVNPYM